MNSVGHGGPGDRSPGEAPLGAAADPARGAEHGPDGDASALPGRSAWRFAGSMLPASDEGCQAPKRLVNVVSGEVLVVDCSSSRRNRCEYCATRYRRRVRRVFDSGWTDSPADRMQLLTLTAPGSDVHYLPSGEACECTPPGGVVLGQWNASAGARWNDFITDVRRSIPGCESLQYCKAAECQQRGALHFHAMVRSRVNLLKHRRKLRQLAIRHGFGHAVDVQAVSMGEGMRSSAASYCAKYVSKACDDRDAMPWMDADGELIVGQGKYRTWTCSRAWGSTMRQLRREQREWAAMCAAVREAQRTGWAAGGVERPAGAGAGVAGPLDPSSHHYATGERTEAVPAGSALAM